MPLYDYRCEHCGAAFTQRRCIDERDTGVTCPECSGTTVSRQLAKFVAFSKGDGGSMTSLNSGGGCSGCSSTGGCGSCGSAHA